MKFLNRLERKFGKFAIPNLMKYMIILYAAGFVLEMTMSEQTMIGTVSFYRKWLSLDVQRILNGEVWRLVTFVLQPPDTHILFTLIEFYMFYLIGRSLENMWGAFRFNVYYFSGLFFQIVAAFAYYGIIRAIFGGGFYIPTIDIGNMYYVNRSMFLAFIVMMPNTTFMLSFIIPVKAKWLGIFYGGLMAYEVLTVWLDNPWQLAAPYTVAVVISILNFLIFFLLTRNYSRISPAEVRRRSQFKRKMNEAKKEYGNVVEFRGRNVVTRHKCAVCGRTELDDDDLEFRFCSKCDGNYEYCTEHLYTHVHVRRVTPDMTGGSDTEE